MSDQWRDQAACKGMDPNLWFPSGSGRPYATALAICKRCPVRQPCLEDALSRSDEVGMWGGTTENERKRIRRQRKKVAA